MRKRYAGYREALRESGIEFRMELVQELGVVLASCSPADVGLDIYGYQAAHKLLMTIYPSSEMMTPEPPDAILLMWDELAPGALNAILNSRLSVPEDIELVGFDDDNFCTLLNPPLTTIRRPARRMGELAAQQLIGLIDGRAAAPETILQDQLIRRGSTGPRF